MSWLRVMIMTVWRESVAVSPPLSSQGSHPALYTSVLVIIRDIRLTSQTSLSHSSSLFANTNSLHPQTLTEKK